MGISIIKKRELIDAALDKHARHEYGVSYEEVWSRGHAQLSEFTHLHHAISDVIEEVERLLEGGASNG